MRIKIRIISFFCWLLSFIIFAGLLIWMRSVGDKQPEYTYISYLWLSDIGFGIIAFIVMIYSLLRYSRVNRIHTEKKRNNKNLNARTRWGINPLARIFLAG